MSLVNYTSEKPLLEAETPEEATDATVISNQRGIWEFWTVKQSRFDPHRRWTELKSGFQLFRRLATEIFALSPGLLILFILSKLWGGVETAVLMHLSSRLLRIVG